MELPLTGLTVIEVGQALAGPLAGAAREVCRAGRVARPSSAGLAGSNLLETCMYGLYFPGTVAQVV